MDFASVVRIRVILDSARDRFNDPCAFSQIASCMVEEIGNEAIAIFLSPEVHPWFSISDVFQTEQGAQLNRLTEGMLFPKHRLWMIRATPRFSVSGGEGHCRTAQRLDDGNGRLLGVVLVVALAGRRLNAVQLNIVEYACREISRMLIRSERYRHAYAHRAGGLTNHE